MSAFQAEYEGSIPLLRSNVGVVQYYRFSTPGMPGNDGVKSIHP